MSEYIVNLHGELGMALAVACAGAGFAREKIVRCGDCEKFDDKWAFCNSFCEAVEPDGFCAWGVRKDD